MISSFTQRFTQVCVAAVYFLAGSTGPTALAGDASACWARFFAEAGVTADAGRIVTFRYAERTLHVPARYLWRGPPSPARGTDAAVWLLAWPPNLAPSTPGDLRRFARDGWASSVMVTIFGHPGQIGGQANLDGLLAWGRHENRGGERDALGYRVYRSETGPGFAAEIHVTPDPNHFIHCHADGAVPNPGCTAQCAIGPSFRLEMRFRKAELPRYAEMDHSLTRAMCCALDPADAGELVWPPRECLGG